MSFFVENAKDAIYGSYAGFGKRGNQSSCSFFILTVEKPQKM